MTRFNTFMKVMDLLSDYYVCEYFDNVIEQLVGIEKNQM